MFLHELTIIQSSAPVLLFLLLTVTPSREPIIKKEWVKPGTHFSCIGSDMSGKEEIDPKAACKTLRVSKIQPIVNHNFLKLWERRSRCWTCRTWFPPLKKYTGHNRLMTQWFGRCPIEPEDLLYRYPQTRIQTSDRKCQRTSASPTWYPFRPSLPG